MLSQEDVKRILQIGVSLSAEKDLEKLLEEILSSVMELAHCDAGTLYLLEKDALHFEIMRNDTLGTYEGANGTKPTLPPVPLNRGNVCAFALLENRTVCISDVRQCGEYDFSGPIRYDAMTGYHTQSMLVVPMSNREGEKLGVLQLINALDENGNVCAFSEDMTLVLESVASQAAITIQNVRYIREIKELLHSFVRTMSSAIDQRSAYTGNHTRHMAAYCEKFLDYLNARKDEVGDALVFSAERREEMLMSVWLHDIGKLVIPLEVMDKPSRLRPEQYTAFRHRMEIIRLKGRIAHLEGEMTAGEYEALLADTEAAEHLIEEINTGRPLTDSQREALDALAGRTYCETAIDVTEGGKNGAATNMTEERKPDCKPWLESEEKAMLMIPRGTLSEEERKVIESHVSATDKLLSGIRFSKELSHVREWASSHHELLNGRGYPRHLKGAEIPLEVRILTILDIFDALTAADRPYKKAKTPEMALEILKMDAENGRLDMELVRLFEESRCWEQ